MIYLNGYKPDCTVLLKDVQAGYTGAKVAQGYAVNQKLLDSVPAEVSDGTYTATPSPAVDSAGYKRLAAFLGSGDLDPYSCQCHDQISLVVLAIAKAKGEATGTAIRDPCGRSPGGAPGWTAPCRAKRWPRQGDQDESQRAVLLHGDRDILDARSLRPGQGAKFKVVKLI